MTSDNNVRYPLVGLVIFIIMETSYILLSLNIILVFIYYYLKQSYHYWQKKGIPCAPGFIPGIGHMWTTLSLRESFPTLCERIYKCYPNHSMIGFYQFQTPTLLLRDLDLAKSVLSTNFSNFKENQIILDPALDPSMSKNPFFATKKYWKETRNVFTTGFSGKKLKSLFLSTREVSYKLKKYLKKLFERTAVVEVELVEFWNKYTGEFVANVGFGLEGHCFEDVHNFEKEISQMFGSSIFYRAREMILFYSPRLAKFLKIRRVPEKLESFLQNAVKGVVETRSHNNGNNGNYNDFLQMMIEYQKIHLVESLDEAALTIYMESFFLNAYESASISLSFLCFQLALHPEIQKKAREEINSVLSKFGGELCYEVLHELKYLEQVLNESIRINPTIPILSRVCTKECYLSGNDGLSFKLNPGDIAVVSLYGFHMDPKYWPDPEKFDPERFNEEEKGKIAKFVFLPFGEGPKMCAGRRMAIIQIKVAMIQLLKDHFLELSPKTRLPLKRDTRFSTSAEGGLWVYIKPLW